MEANEESILQQRQKKDKFLDEQEAEAENVYIFLCFYRRTKAERHRVVRRQGGKSGYEMFFSSNLKNANRPLINAQDNCQLALYSVSA
ncbi:hypothetical protein Plhal304r1_c017g0061311 [Plasmopara halstedii]